MSVLTYTGVVHPWMCDNMGHLNVRYYVGMFDDASFQLLGRIAGQESQSALGWADVRMEIDYKREIPASKLVSVASRVESVGTSSLTCFHEMRGSIDDMLHATMRAVTVRFDLTARSRLALSEIERKIAASLSNRL